MTDRTGREPSLPQEDHTPAPPQPTGAEPGTPAEYALLEVLLTLSDINPAEREAALELLLELGEKAVPALIRATQEQRRDSRLAAAYAMGVLGGEAFLPELARLLRDEDDWVRTLAAEVFVMLAAKHEAYTALAGGISQPGLADDTLNELAVQIQTRWALTPHLLAQPLTVGSIPVLLRMLEVDLYHLADVQRIVVGMGMEALPALLNDIPSTWKQWATRREDLVLRLFKYSSDIPNEEGPVFTLIGALAVRTDDTALRQRIGEAMYTAFTTLYPYGEAAIVGALRSLRDVPLIIALLERTWTEFPMYRVEFARALISLLSEFVDPVSIPALKRWLRVPGVEDAAVEALRRQGHML